MDDFIETTMATMKVAQGHTIKGEGKSLQVLDFDENEGLTLNVEELSKILGREDVIKKPVAVLSVAGAYRTGKSFLLNFLMRYLTNTHEANWIGNEEEELRGFIWRQGIDTATIGIHMWSQPFHVTLDDGKEVAIILMDTQGLFDERLSADGTSLIFGLSALISSTQVYNIADKFDDNQFQHLKLTLEIVQMIQTMESEDETENVMKTPNRTAHTVADGLGSGTAVDPEDTGRENSQTKEQASNIPFQRFVYVVRDWIDPKTYGYGEDGGRKYLDSFITGRDTSTQYKTVLEYARSCYEQMECFLMPQPGYKATETRIADDTSDSDEEKRVEDFRGKPKDLRSRFKKQLRKLGPFLLGNEKIQLKRVGGVEVNGGSLLQFIQTWVSVVKQGRLPKVSSSSEEFVNKWNRYIYEEIIKSHDAHILERSEALGTEYSLIYPKDWEDDMKQKEQRKQNRLTKMLKGDEKSREEYMTSLDRHLREKRNEIVKIINKHNLERIMMDHRIRCKKIYEEQPADELITKLEETEKAISNDEHRSMDLLKDTASGESYLIEHLERELEGCMSAVREDFYTRYNEVATGLVLEGHRSRVKKIVPTNILEMNFPKVEKDYQSEKKSTLEEFQEKTKGGCRAKSESKRLVESCLQESWDLILNKDYNRLVLVKTLKERDEATDQNLKNEETISDSEIEKENEKTWRNLADAMRGGEGAREECELQLEVHFKKTKTKIQKHHNEKIRDQNFNKFKEKLKEIEERCLYNGRSDSTILLSEISKARQHIIHTFVSNARGETTEIAESKMKLLKSVDKLEKTSKQEFNKVLVRHVIDEHNKRAAEVYNTKNPKRLTYSNSRLDDIKKNEEEQTKKSFTQSCITLTKEEMKEHDLALENQLTIWREKIDLEQKEKEETKAEVIKNLNAVLFHQYLETAKTWRMNNKSLISKLRKTKELLSEQKGHIRILIYICIAIGFGLASIVYSFSWPIILAGGAFSFLISWAVPNYISDPIIELIGFTKTSTDSMLAWTNKTQTDAMETCMIPMIASIEDQPPIPDKNKVFNIAFAAATSGKQFHEFIPGFLWYLMTPEMPSAVYITDLYPEGETIKSRDTLSISETVKSCCYKSWIKNIGISDIFSGRFLDILIDGAVESSKNLKRVHDKLGRPPVLN